MATYALPVPVFGRGQCRADLSLWICRVRTVMAATIGGQAPVTLLDWQHPPLLLLQVKYGVEEMGCNQMGWPLSEQCMGKTRQNYLKRVQLTFLGYDSSKLGIKTPLTLICKIFCPGFCKDSSPISTKLNISAVSRSPLKSFILLLCEALRVHIFLTIFSHSYLLGLTPQVVSQNHVSRRQA